MFEICSQDFGYDHKDEKVLPQGNGLTRNVPNYGVRPVLCISVSIGLSIEPIVHVDNNPLFILITKTVFISILNIAVTMSTLSYKH